jgi:hypothetical protein
MMDYVDYRTQLSEARNFIPPRSKIIDSSSVDAIQTVMAVTSP